VSRRTASVSTPRQLARVPQTCSTAHAPQRPFPRPQSQTTHSYTSDDMPCASAPAAAWGSLGRSRPCLPSAASALRVPVAAPTVPLRDRPVRASGLSPSAAGVGVALHPRYPVPLVSAESERKSVGYSFFVPLMDMVPDPLRRVERPRRVIAYSFGVWRRGPRRLFPVFVFCRAHDFRSLRALFFLTSHVNFCIGIQCYALEMYQM
jgi:hypothetical protein